MNTTENTKQSNEIALPVIDRNEYKVTYRSNRYTIIKDFAGLDVIMEGGFAPSDLEVDGSILWNMIYDDLEKGYSLGAAVRMARLNGVQIRTEEAK